MGVSESGPQTRTGDVFREAAPGIDRGDGWGKLAGARIPTGSGRQLHDLPFPLLHDTAAAIEHALALLRDLSLEKLDFPLPGSGRMAPAVPHSEGQLELDRLLRFIQNLLPSWADNISLTYFNHARTFPISIGG